MADLKLNRLLERFDAWCEHNEAGASVGPIERFEATRIEATPRVSLDLTRGAITTIVWATGFRPDYRWLHVPVLDHKGRLRHDGGIVDAPGLYALGLNFMRRRKSSFIHGAEDDVHDLGTHLAAYLRHTERRSTRLVAHSAS